MTAREPCPVPSLSPRDRAMRAQALALHPRERLAAMQQLIDQAWAVLQRNPAGLDHFIRRNDKARSIAQLDVQSSDGS
jgi:hypothetical protein